MTRNLKALGLALVAVFAMSAVAASAASAVTQEFHSEGEPTTLTGKQHAGNDVFTTDGGKVECTTATYVGTAAKKTTTTISVSPTYSGCTALSGFASASIVPNGCEYLFHITTGGSNTGTVDIVCTGTNEITVNASAFGETKCVIHIPPQTGLGTIHFTNTGSGTTRELTVDVNITSGIRYTQTAGTGFGACASNTGTTNGSYVGHALVTGETDPGTTHTGIWIE